MLVVAALDRTIHLALRLTRGRNKFQKKTKKPMLQVYGVSGRRLILLLSLAVVHIAINASRAKTGGSARQ